MSRWREQGGGWSGSETKSAVGEDQVGGETKRMAGETRARADPIPGGQMWMREQAGGAWDQEGPGR